MADRARPTDHDLELALREIAGRLDYPPTPDLVAAVRRRLESRPVPLEPPRRAWLRYRRALTLAAAVLLFLAVSLMAFSPGLRTAVADRLGLRGVVITSGTPVSTPTPAPPTPTQQAIALTPAGSPTPSATASPPPEASLGLGELVTLDQARAWLNFAVTVPSIDGLGPPDAIYLDTASGSDVVWLVYLPRAGLLPEASTTGVGLLVAEFVGSVEQPFVQKGLAPETQVVPVTVNGDQGYWIEGELHSLIFRDAAGQYRTQEGRLAGNTLLWTHGDVTFRLEAQISEAEALRIAASFR